MRPPARRLSGEVSTMSSGRTSAAVVGLGYWGPNRLRALNELPETEARWICDLDPERLARHAERNPLSRPTADLDEALADPEVDAVVIAVPVVGHHALATRALEAGKHVFVEKPLARSSAEAEELVALADRQGLVLACGHTFLHSPPVLAAKRIIDAGDLGEIYFVSSSRVNLGPYRSDVSVLFDLGPHDFSILRYWLERNPASVSAIGRDAISRGVADVAFVHLDFLDGLIAHVELSWLAPSKLRRTVVVGSEKMLVYEDGTAEPLRIYDSGIEYSDPETYGEYQLSYRNGNIVSLRVDTTEPIIAEMRDFAGAIAEARKPIGNSDVAVDVLRIVEAGEESIARAGERVDVEPAEGGTAGLSGRTKGARPVSPAPVEPGPVDVEQPLEPARPPRVVSAKRTRRDLLTRRTLLVVDLLAIELALVASSAIAGIRPGVFDLAWDALPMLVVWALIFKLYGLYDRDIKRISHTGIDDLPWVFHSLIVGTLALWIYMKLVPDQQMLLREVAWFAAFSLPLVILARSLARRAIVHALGSENVLIAANGATCELIARKLDAHPEYGQRPKAILVPLGDSKIPPQAAAIAEPWVGGAAELERMIATGGFDRVLVARDDYEAAEVFAMMDLCRRYAVKVGVLPGVSDAFGPSLELDEVEGVTVLGINPPVLGRTSAALKRGFDLAIATPTLLVAMPAMLVIAVAVRVDSPGPALFRQRRVGRGGKTFTLFKFRTMSDDAEARQAELMERSLDPNWLHLERDPRVTRVGGFLRRTSLDEIPQLINVLRGEMSLVGPAAAPRVGGRERQGLGPRSPRPDARRHRAVAGPRPHRHPLRGDGEARLHLRGQLVHLDGHPPAPADAPGGDPSARRQLSRRGGGVGAEDRR